MSESNVQNNVYHRAKLIQIILISANALSLMGVYSLIGMAAYAGNIGFGIATAAVGGILVFTRIFDAITDPLVAFLFDRVHTRFGKLRILIITGWAIEMIALLCMFSFMAGKGFGIVAFILLYMLYVVGYTIVNMTNQTLPALITNDPKQRPVVGVWQTAFNYLTPMTISIILNVILLPKFGGTYNARFLSTAAWFICGVTALGTLLACIGISPYDREENFSGLNKKHQNLKFKDMWEVLRHNKPLQRYIIAASSDKIAQQAGSQAIVTTMMMGIIIGNMGFSTILSMISMVPSIIFAAVGAKYAGKHGNMETITFWTGICIIAGIVNVAFLALSDPTKIASFGIPMVVYVLLQLFLNGSKMCVTTGNTAFMADIIDYELYRSGNYVPAVVTGTYSLIDKLVSSVSGLLATAGVALIGYTATMPQPGDPSTPQVFWMTMFLMYGTAIIGWICTLLALKHCELTKDKMAEVQEQIAARKAALKEEKA
jgi:GPH family glycoside/pentoside/hexuronide:cation symporter